ncbi:MAG: ABC transporter permease subunit, partial [Planctomycetes bacterium]|nr:ABC transporter permease subunit [Planctomycetota bacterium]
MIRGLLRLFLANRIATLAAAFIGLLALLAITAPWITPYGPLQIGDQPLTPPSAANWLGTDDLGRDVFTRVIYGCRISLVIAALGVAVSLIAGTAMGLLAGYFGGLIDGVLSRVTDVMFCLPDILLALVIMAVLGPGFDRIALAIAIVYTPIFARVCRGSVLSLRQQPYVEAARAVGVGRGRILLRHILPNVAGPLIVQATLSLAFAVLAEAALSFLGLSGQTDAPSWGLMLRRGKDFMELAWWV